MLSLVAMIVWNLVLVGLIWHNFESVVGLWELGRIGEANQGDLSEARLLGER